MNDRLHVSPGRGLTEDETAQVSGGGLNVAAGLSPALTDNFAFGDPFSRGGVLFLYEIFRLGGA